MTGNTTIEKCFEEAEQTGSLYLSSKGLRDFPDVGNDCELIDVIEADLSRNRFAEFPVEICDFIMLERLDLYHNAIRNIPELHPQLKWLTKLNLRRNQVCSLPLSIGRLPLRVLNLSNNKLTSLPVEIGYLTLLQDLDLSCNELSRLPSSMGEMISLKEINVRRNQLQVLPDELSKLKLVKLDFSCNRVSVIPPAYRLITTLSSLELSHNPLTSPPAHVCLKGRQHIFKYLSVVAQQDKKRPLHVDRDVRKLPFSRKGSSQSLKEEYLGHNADLLSSDKVKRTISLDMTGAGTNFRKNEEKEVYRPSSLRERDKLRKPLTNVFETDEKRREIQKEIERAQRLLSESIDQHEVGSQPDTEITEGEELEKEFLSIEMEQRVKKEEEDQRLIEERRRTAMKLHRDQQDIIQKQKADGRRRTLDNTNGYAERRRTGAMSGVSKPDIPPRPATLERQPAHPLRKPRSSSLQGTGKASAAEGGKYRSRQEEDMKTREALMQQSRREAQLSRQRLEEERLKSKKKKDSPLSRESLNTKSKPDMESRSPEPDSWDESIFQNIHKRSNMGNVRSLPVTLKNKDDPNFTIKRMYDSAREEFEKLEILREALESRLKVTLPDDLPASLADGVVLCHLINQMQKGTIPSIHIPSAGVPKLTMTKCQKNVDSFLEACRKLGVMKEDMCSAGDILEEKSAQRVCITVQALLKRADNS